MGQRGGAHVPRFGSWDSDDHMPFTQAFNNARAGKGGKPLNPNDPVENPEAFGLSPVDTSVEKTAVKKPSVESAGIPSAKARVKETRHQQDVPARKQTPETHAQRFQRDASYQNSRAVANGSPSGSPSEHPPRRGEREVSRVASAPNEDSPRTVDRSQGRLVNKPGAGASAKERRTSADGGTAFPPGTPQRVRLRSSSSLPKPEVEKTPAIPKFGDWNVNDPSAGQGFTMIFDSVRNERKTGGPSPVQVPDNVPETYTNQQKPAAKKWCCCFGGNAEQ